MKRILIAILSICIIVSVASGYVAFAQQLMPDQYALQQVVQIASLNNPHNKWTTDTTIINEVVLYDFNDYPNGYVYMLSTDAKETGYIQIDVIDGIYSVHSYSFDGTNEVISLINNSAIKMPGTYSAAHLSEIDSTKIYYGGSMRYAVVIDDEVVDLASGKKIKETKEELAVKYQSNSARSNTQISIISEDEPTWTMVSNYNNFRLVDMYDFQGDTIQGGHTSTISNHCEPTAGTNIMKYYDLCQGITQLYSADWLTFNQLYRAMNTNGITEASPGTPGTYWDVTFSFGYSGILDYMEDCGVSPANSYRYAWGALININQSPPGITIRVSW